MGFITHPVRIYYVLKGCDILNQIEIGKLIAECRKNKNMTQTQLAEILNISNKSVSKWENGNCCRMPLYMNRCAIYWE